MLISRLGVTAEAETLQVHGKHRPDVLFQLRGLRVAIESKFRDTPNAERIALRDARRRVAAGIAHIAAALTYPSELRSAPTAKILDALADACLRFRIVTETFETDAWLEGDAASLMEALRRAQEALTEDDIVQKTARSLSAHLERVARVWIGQPGACDRLSTLLGIAANRNEDLAAAADRRQTAAKVSALVVANAFIFQEQLARTDKRVETLRKMRKSNDLVDMTERHWRWIWSSINYVSIFQLGERILDELPANGATTDIVRSLLDEAHKICTEQAALRHDLMGRIYHCLLHHAKYLGTYYTSVPAATLLLKTALDLPWANDFGSAEALTDFKVADFACGTGTLLMAATQALTDRFVKARAENGRSIEAKDLSLLHSALMQGVMHGYDILPSAVHLTASTLALLAPDVAFRRMNLFVMPIGIDHGVVRLGSLDFLGGDEIETQLSLDRTHLDTIQTGAGDSKPAKARVPRLDLCVLNPPFVSSRYRNKLFGSLSDDRARLQKAVCAKARQIGISAVAGLGALFVPLADRHMKPGGRIAFVLPLALASGEAWGAVRAFIAARYHLEIVITSHEPARTNFSENTDLSEIMFVARKLKPGERPGETRYVTLRRNPATIHEALDLATRISFALEEAHAGRAAAIVRSPERLIGEIATLPAPKGSENWTAALFAQTSLARIHWELEKTGLLTLPAAGSHRLPLCRLDRLGNLGHDVRDIADAFEIDRTGSQWTPYAAFWDHAAERVTQIAQRPNAFLVPRARALDGRRLKPAAALWAGAGPILLVSRLRSNTHRLIGAGFDQAVLGNTWWSFAAETLSVQQRKALLLWLNGTIGVLLYFGARTVTQATWMQMKKPAWQAMPVLNVLRLSDAQLERLAHAYDQLAHATLRPIARLGIDPVRMRIDEALCAVLSLPDLATLRELISREPGLTGRAASADDPIEDAATSGVSRVGP